MPTIKSQVNVCTWTLIVELIALCLAALSASTPDRDLMVLLAYMATGVALAPLLFFVLRMAWRALTDLDDERPVVRVRPAAVWVCRECKSGVPRSRLCAMALARGQQICEACAHPALAIPQVDTDLEVA